MLVRRAAPLVKLMTRITVAALASSAVICPPAAAQSIPLANGVPRDVQMFVHGRSTDTPNPMESRLDVALSRLFESGVHRDILELVTYDFPAEKRQEVEAFLGRITDTFARVDWLTLFEREMVFAMRFAIPMPEYLILCRVPQDRVGELTDGLRAFFADFAAMIGPKASVRDVERQTGRITLFSIQGAPVELVVGSVGDVVVMTTSTLMANSSMSMLANGSGEDSISGHPKLQAALPHLPSATEALSYFDAQSMGTFMIQSFQMSQAFMTGPEAAGIRDIMAVLGALVRECNVCDYTVTTGQSDGLTATSTTYVRLVPRVGEMRMARCFVDQNPPSDWYRMVPASATSFAISSGIDLAALYDLLTGLVRENLPSGNDLLAQWAEMQKGMGLDLRNDVFAAISGESFQVTLPSSRPGAFGGEDAVCLVRLERPDAVAGGVTRMLRAFEGYVTSRGQSVEIRNEGGLNEVRLAAFPWIRPVLGVRGSDLVLATSPEALKHLESVGRGQEPHIKTNPRYRRLGIGQDEGVRDMSYQEMNASLTAIADIMSAAGFFLSVLPEDRETRKMLLAGRILTKVAPVIRDLDLSCDVGYEVVPGESPDFFLTRTVYRFHDQPADQPASASGR